jgi:hypothetical protein
MKKILILLGLIMALNVTAQPVLLKQYDGEGSCWAVKTIWIDCLNNTTTVSMAIYPDYLAMVKNPSKCTTHEYKIKGYTYDIRESIIDWLKCNDSWFNTAQKTWIKDLPKAPDTMWISISNAPINPAITRKIGVFSYNDNPLVRSCGVAGIVRHYLQDTLLSQYTQEIAWSLDNTDSIYDANFGWVKSYDYFKGAQQYYKWSDYQTIQNGIHWADPAKINDRLKY